MMATIESLLAVTYGFSLCACFGFWGLWRRWLERISASLFARRVLVGAYWLLALTVVSDLLASMKLREDDVSPGQFKILFLMAVGMFLQMALFALVFAPVAMRFTRRPCSLTKTLIILEGGAFISILAWGIGFIVFVHDYRQFAK